MHFISPVMGRVFREAMGQLSKTVCFTLSHQPFMFYIVNYYTQRPQYKKGKTKAANPNIGIGSLSLPAIHNTLQLVNLPDLIPLHNISKNAVL